jgi:hypothetical protein
MSMSSLAYARCAYKSFSRSARHLLQLIASHQSLHTGWAYLSYQYLSEESSLTRRRVIQVIAFLEAQGALEVRRGHGRGHVNFYRILREEDGLPVPHCSPKKVKSETPTQEEKVKFPTPPEPEKVKSETLKPLESLEIVPDKVLNTKERAKKGAPTAPFSLSAQDGTDVPEPRDVTPEQLLQLGLTPGSHFWRQALGEEDSRSPA